MESSPNPFQTPAISTSKPSTRNFDHSKFVPGVIAFLMAVAALIGFFSILIPSLGSFTNPRFGWVGLILCLNPLIFLYAWFRAPAKQTLMAAAFMTLSIGVINAVQLLVMGTVAEAANTFTDRLHSSWLWSVLPFFVAGLYLVWHALGMKQSQPITIQDQTVSNKIS
jgi:hypothetical protein